MRRHGLPKPISLGIGVPGVGKVKNHCGRHCEVLKVVALNWFIVKTRDVEAEAEAGSGSGGSGTFSVEAKAEARKIHRFRFHIGGRMEREKN